MTDPHLDDEQLSLLLDGVDADGRAHVEDDACGTCGARLASLRVARDTVASAVVAPLPAEVLERIVGAALDAPPVADVVPLGSSPRRRRLSTPPPAWLLGAAAGLAVLVGVAGLLRAADLSGSGDDAGLAITAGDESSESSEADSSGTARQLPAGGATAGAAASTAAADPELVVGDLADLDDPSELALALDGLRLTPTADAIGSSSNFAAREAAPTAAASGGGASTAEEATTDKAAASPAPPATTIPADRARCRAQADAIGAGRFAALLSTATLRWKGEPAEVLVFRLAEPSSPDTPETRQALVLSRPGCELLADPRF